MYVHGSTGRPGVDAGSGWYQRAEIVVSDAVRQQDPTAWPLDLYGGSVTVDGELFGNVVPLPCDRKGPADVEFEGDEGWLVMSGSRVRIVLTGTPGPAAPFPGIKVLPDP